MRIFDEEDYLLPERYWLRDAFVYVAVSFLCLFLAGAGFSIFKVGSRLFRKQKQE